MRQFYGRLEKCVLSAGKTRVHKIAHFRGGYFGFRGGGECRLYFMGARTFLIMFMFDEGRHLVALQIFRHMGKTVELLSLILARSLSGCLWLCLRPVDIFVSVVVIICFRL